MTTFNKRALSVTEQANLLLSRGLHFTDSQRIEGYLRTIGYYRLSGYFYTFLQSPKNLHQYKPNTTFDQVLNLYRFDRKLRLIIFNEIEKIEVAIRSALVNIICEDTQDIFWLTKETNYKAGKFTGPNGIEANISRELKNSNEEFIKHFKRNYPDDEYPPAWMLVQILPLGSITFIYRHLSKQSLRKKVAAQFRLEAPVFESWIRDITLTRNLCCHHARIWNRTFKVKRPQKLKEIWIAHDKEKIFTMMSVIKYIIDVISPNNNFKDNLKELLEDFPDVDIHAMGFPPGWETSRLWRG